MSEAVSGSTTRPIVAERHMVTATQPTDLAAQLAATHCRTGKELRNETSVVRVETSAVQIAIAEESAIEAALETEEALAIVEASVIAEALAIEAAPVIAATLVIEAESATEAALVTAVTLVTVAALAIEAALEIEPEPESVIELATAVV